MRGRVCAAIAVIGLGVSALGRGDGLSPAMDPDRPVQCARDTDNHGWRLQCDDAHKTCLYAADDELDVDGNRSKPLERVRECAPDAAFDRAKLEAAGYVMVPARADTPFGWMRDERGRVFQVNFDLKRRMYFGAGYTPKKFLDNPFESRRSSLDFGLLVLDVLDGGKSPTRHRIRLLEGEVHIAPFSAEIVVAHYDVSHRYVDPLLRITTFAGTPQRHDLHLNIGLWSEAGGMEIHPTPVGYSQLYKHAAAQVTFDLWQSADLSSYARVRTGLGLEGQRTEVMPYRSAVTASSVFEVDMALDDAGFHNVRFELAHEMPRYFTPLEQTGKLAQRLRARLQYEAIVLAINDQPLTLKLAAGGEKRDDLPGVPDQWAFVMDAGLRFSLWAPPRARP